jgi:predicted RNA-binding Zn-ribbon protein involved in translation (DUF1610 family)
MHLEITRIEPIRMMQSASEDNRPACPECGTLLLRAVHGLPTRDLANDPTVKIMGCLVDEKMVEWFCPECNGSNMEGDDD